MDITLRKSLFMSYTKCQRQGEYERNAGEQGYSELNTEVPQLLKGQIYHHAMEDLYNILDIKVLMELKDKDAVYEYIKGSLPEVTHEEMKKWLDWYAAYETDRFIELRDKGEQDYFMPFRQEHYVEADIDGIKRTGYIDRIDRVGDKQLIIVEYKTGESYDPSNSLKLSAIRKELEWYRSIVVEMEEFKDYEVIGWKLINPTLRIVRVDRYITQTRMAVYKQLVNIERIIKGEVEPKKNIGPLCGWCKYQQECLGETVDGEFTIFGDQAEFLSSWVQMKNKEEEKDANIT